MKYKHFINFIKGKRHIKLQCKGFQFELFDCPGLWMNSESLRAIQERVITITAHTCGSHPTKGLYVDTNLMKDKIISIYSKDNIDYAFNAMAGIGDYKGLEVLHTGPAYCFKPNQGIIYLLFFFSLTHFFLKNNLKKFYLTTISHVPKVFGLMINHFSHMYPNEDPYALPSQAQKEIRDLLVNSYIKEIEPEYNYRIKDDFILKGFRLQKNGTLVPSPHTKETVPKHRLKKFNDRCLAMIDYQKGDALIMVGEVGLKQFFENVPLMIGKMTLLFANHHN